MTYLISVFSVYTKLETVSKPMKVSRDHTLYFHPYDHLSPQKMVAFTILLCYSYMRCGVWRSLVARTAGGREVAGSNPVAPIFLTNSRISEV